MNKKIIGCLVIFFMLLTITMASALDNKQKEIKNLEKTDSPLFLIRSQKATREKTPMKDMVQNFITNFLDNNRLFFGGFRFSYLISHPITLDMPTCPLNTECGGPACFTYNLCTLKCDKDRNYDVHESNMFTGGSDRTCDYTGCRWCTQASCTYDSDCTYVCKGK